MPSSIASESGGKGGQHVDMSAAHHKDATAKFPNGYDDNAKYHHTTLKAQNKNKVLKPGTLDHYLLLTFFPEIKSMKSKASKSPSKKADKSPAGKAAAATADVSRAAETHSRSASSSDEEDTSVRQVQGSKSDLEQRAAKDDALAAEATISDIVADPNKRPTVDMDADTLLGLGNPEEDTPENNAEIAEAANDSNSKNRMAAAAKARKSSASASDEMLPGASGRKRRPADESDSSGGSEHESRPIATKSRKTREPVVVDSESEEEVAGMRKCRFTRRCDCTLLSDWASEIDKIRPHVQRMFLQRDGAELRDGSVHHALNFHAILAVAGARLSRENYRPFKKACMNSFEEAGDA
jgi:hypothetical protein